MLLVLITYRFLFLLYFWTLFFRDVVNVPLSHQAGS